MNRSYESIVAEVIAYEMVQESVRYGRASAAGCRAKRSGGAFKPLRSGARSGRVRVYRLEEVSEYVR